MGYYCKKCGQEMAEDSAFCSRCGTPIQKENEEKEKELAPSKEISPTEEKKVGRLLASLAVGVLMALIRKKSEDDWWD